MNVVIILHHSLMKAVLCLIAVVASSAAAFAQTASPLPPPNPFRFVNDYAGVMDTGTTERMEAMLRSLKEKGDIEFAVVTIKTTGDQDIFDYSLALARGWCIGSREGEQNGLLLLVAVDDHKYFVQVSRHLEGDLPDGLVGEIGRRMQGPFRRGDYSGGLMTAVQTFISTLQEKRGFTIGDVDRRQAYHEPEKVREQPGLGISRCVLYLIVMIVVVFLLSSRRRGRGGGCWNLLFLGSLLNSGGRGSSSSGWTGGGFGGSGGSSGGFGGFGGGGFGGGGSFGGGGAGGSW